MSKRLLCWGLLVVVASVLLICAPQKMPRPAVPTHTSLASSTTHPASLSLHQAQAILLLADRSIPLQNWHSDDDLFRDGLHPPPAMQISPIENQPAPVVRTARTEMTYFGHMAQGGTLFAFVHLGEEDYVLRAGDALAKTYRVLAVTPHTVRLRHRSSRRIVSLSLGEDS